MTRQPLVDQNLLTVQPSRSHTASGRTPLNEWSARRKDLTVTTNNILERQTSMPMSGFKPKIPVTERPNTHALDRTVTGIGPI